MVARVDSLMEMSKINQALCKQLAFLLSRTAFNRTKETFLACCLCTGHDKQKSKLNCQREFSSWLKKNLITRYQIISGLNIHTSKILHINKLRKVRAEFGAWESL